MIEGLLDSTTIPMLEQVARFSEQRHKLLAGNIANIDTPGYKPRDLPVDAFQQALKEAVEARRRGADSPAVVAAEGRGKSIEGFFPEELFQPTTAEPQNLTFHDRNNRSIEKAVTEMMKNVGKQRFAVEVMTAQLNMLQAAISGRV